MFVLLFYVSSYVVVVEKIHKMKAGMNKLENIPGYELPFPPFSLLIIANCDATAFVYSLSSFACREPAIAGD